VYNTWRKTEILMRGRWGRKKSRDRGKVVTKNSYGIIQSRSRNFLKSRIRIRTKSFWIHNADLWSALATFFLNFYFLVWESLLRRMWMCFLFSCRFCFNNFLCPFYWVSPHTAGQCRDFYSTLYKYIEHVLFRPRISVWERTVIDLWPSLLRALTILHVKFWCQLKMAVVTSLKHFVNTIGYRKTRTRSHHFSEQDVFCH
jgi:hypothetical protein